jgi:hypothetical protein
MPRHSIDGPQVVREDCPEGLFFCAGFCAAFLAYLWFSRGNCGVFESPKDTTRCPVRVDSLRVLGCAGKDSDQDTLGGPDWR